MGRIAWVSMHLEHNVAAKPGQREALEAMTERILEMLDDVEERVYYPSERRLDSLFDCLAGRLAAALLN